MFLSAFSSYAQVTSYMIDPGKIDQKLSSRLDSLFLEDQKYRLQSARLKKEGASAKTLDSLTQIIKTKDVSNLQFVEKLLARHGWLAPEKVGMEGTQAVFLVIQHADLDTQKKYYPLILQAEKDGQILSSNVAILEDRIAVREGRKQHYGSQAFYDADAKRTIVHPLENPENIDEFRKLRGLPPMKDYLKDWNLTDYKADLPKAKQHLEKQLSKS